MDGGWWMVEVSAGNLRDDGGGRTGIHTVHFVESLPKLDKNERKRRIMASKERKSAEEMGMRPFASGQNNILKQDKRNSARAFHCLSRRPSSHPSHPSPSPLVCPSIAHRHCFVYPFIRKWPTNAVLLVTAVHPGNPSSRVCQPVPSSRALFARFLRECLLSSTLFLLVLLLLFIISVFFFCFRLMTSNGCTQMGRKN